MKQIKTHLPRIIDRNSNRFTVLRGAILSPIYWLLAHFYRTPGLFFHRHVFTIGLRLLFKRKLKIDSIYKLMFSPLDSVRYFEFHFFWQSFLCNTHIGDYLDVSSPRLFPVVLMDKFPQLSAVLVNPDPKDLALTRELIEACNFNNRCKLYNCCVDDLNFEIESFDTITCISVIEHIPQEGDLQAVKKMWSLLRRGGRLLLSVPCAKEAFEEFINFNEYGLLEPDKDGFVFGQLFYDEQLLEDHIFKITGKPIRYSVYGEKKFGLFIKNRDDRMTNSNYPFWREPYMMGVEYAYFSSIAALPGWGLVTMEFIKK